MNEPVIEMEANEFLKFIKHNEYSIVKQLHKLLAKISLLGLMLNSKPHREVMLKVLKQAYMPYNARIDKIDRLVGNIMMDNYTSHSVMMRSRQMVVEVQRLCTSLPRLKIAPCLKS